MSVLTSNQITEITAYVNHYRALNQAAPFVWDNTIQSVSQDWSDYLLANNLFQHSGNQNYGENLAYFQGYGTDIMTLLKLAVDSWYNEISSYDFSNPGFSKATGHFTCLVWASSTNFAMGISINKTSSEVDIVLNTSPPGNIQGEFQANVLPVKTTAPIPVPNPPVPPTPIPISKSATILKIINDLNNVIYSIRRKQPKWFIIQSINAIITEIMTANIPISISVINTLSIIITAFQKKNYIPFILNSLNLVIDQLKTYL